MKLATLTLSLLATLTFSGATKAADQSQPSTTFIENLLNPTSDTKHPPYCSWNGGPCNTLPDCCTGLCDAQLHVCIQNGK